ncbi:MAG: hypothetical protein LBQ27_00785 [Clostridiales bacterium]|jgi:hypothetical protein|nr:hypothetical protein [Clostridiales bacterium]
MRSINIFYVIGEIALSILLIFAPNDEFFSFLFTVAYLGLMFLLALSSRTLSYCYHRKSDKKNIALISIDFIFRIIVMMLIPMIFFYKNWFVLGVICGLSIVSLLCVILTNGKLIVGVTITKLAMGDGDIKLSRIVLINWAVYVATVSLVFFPDYTKPINFIFCIPLFVGIFIFLRGIRSLISYIEKEKKKEKMIAWILSYIFSLAFFLGVRYILHVETPISIFTIIGMLIMLPYFNAAAKIMSKRQ